MQFGGQTPLKLAKALEKAGIPILGTSVDSIDLAEDRDRFKRLLDKLGLRQPENGISYSVEQSRTGREQARAAARRAPVLRARRPRDGGDPHRGGAGGLPARDACRDWCRPRSRRATRTTRPARSTRCSAPTRCCSTATCRTRSRSTSTRLCDGTNVFVAGIMEHIEEAGIHSGDSACSLPPHSLSPALIAEIEAQTRKLALALRRRSAS